MGSDPHFLSTALCAGCGCSLVRLGIEKDRAVTLEQDGVIFSFCCVGCQDVFNENPTDRLSELDDLIVCPVCLAEKVKGHAVSVKHLGDSIYFCRCPHCVKVFRGDPDYYVGRLAGTIPFSGIFSDDSECC